LEDQRPLSLAEKNFSNILINHTRKLMEARWIYWKNRTRIRLIFLISWCFHNHTSSNVSWDCKKEQQSTIIPFTLLFIFQYIC
jgi:hypothetical protein